MAILYVILDGVGDKASKVSNETPLEAAFTPNLDRLTAKSAMGILYTVSRGIAPESDAGVFSLLSYDPSRLDLSRGVVEALGSGLQFSDGDLALRCNFASVQDRIIVDRRAGRNVTAEQAIELVNAVNQDGVLAALSAFELKATIGHRCSLVLHAKGSEFSDAVSNLDPAYSKKGRVTIALTNVELPAAIPKCVPLNKTKSAARTAHTINEFASRVHDLLKNHPINIQRRLEGNLPANFLLMRDAGTKVPKVRSIKQKFGWRSVVIADMPVELGISKVIGMDVEAFHPERTLEGYALRAKKALELLDHYDLVYVHLKGPDEPGHDGDFEGKKKAIEDIDLGFFGHLSFSQPHITCVTADHSTPCGAKGHTDDPVPLLIAGPRVNPDGSMRFTEAFAKKGRLGTINHGYQVLDRLKRLL
jgi:2,3-bisphosphoglycerate-independent phosphoglycerate mutase